MAPHAGEPLSNPPAGTASPQRLQKQQWKSKTACPLWAGRTLLPPGGGDSFRGKGPWHSSPSLTQSNTFLHFPGTRNLVPESSPQRRGFPQKFNRQVQAGVERSREPSTAASRALGEGAQMFRGLLGGAASYWGAGGRPRGGLAVGPGALLWPQPGTRWARRALGGTYQSSAASPWACSHPPWEREPQQ